MYEKSEPTFSIIIPAYNATTTITKCLDSILSQNFSDFEVLLIDDGSEDSLNIKITDYLTDERIKYFHTNHIGCSNARNIGITKAIGEYLLFCDADDEYLPNALYNIFSNIQTKPELIIFGAKIINCTPSFKLSDIIPQNKTIKTNVRNAFFLETGTKPYIWNCCYKRQMINNAHLKFDKNITCGEDLVFQHSVFLTAHDVIFISNKCYKYYYCNEISQIFYYLNNPELRILQHIDVINACYTVYFEKSLKPNKLFYEWVISFIFNDFINFNVEIRRQLQPNIKKLLKNIKYKKQILRPKLALKFHIMNNKKLQDAYLNYKHISIHKRRKP